MSMTEERVEMAQSEKEQFYQELDAANLPALWLHLHSMITPQPVVDAIPFMWHWDEIYPRVLKAGEIPIDRGSERRVLILANPGLPNLYTTTRNIYAGVQMVKPGEIAPAHRHVQSAIRFILKGSGAFTSVEGERCFMEPYDLVLTPPWQWHDHGNETDEPIIWMDGLDINLVRSLNASFFEPYSGSQYPVTKPDNNSLKQYGGGKLVPAWPGDTQPKSKSSPLLIYKWADTRRSLQDLAESGFASPFDDVMLTYTNPATGGSVLPTLSCNIQMLRPATHTKAHRHSSSAVYYVVEGSGQTIINGTVHQWKEGDFLALPPWFWHEHINSSNQQPAILFSITDVPVISALGFYREESYAENNGYQQ